MSSSTLNISPHLSEGTVVLKAKMSRFSRDFFLRMHFGRERFQLERRLWRQFRVSAIIDRSTVTIEALDELREHFLTSISLQYLD